MQGRSPQIEREGEDGLRNPCPTVEVPRGREEDRGTLGGGLSTEGRKSPERGGPSGDKKRQITILRDYVEVLRKDRNRMEAKLLNEHIHRVTEGSIQGSALEDLPGRNPERICCPSKEGIAAYLRIFRVDK